MTYRIDKLVGNWIRDAEFGSKVERLNTEINYLSKRLYSKYEPCPFDDFKNRLDEWIFNVDSEDDRRLLFELASNISFIGHNEFDALYRSTFRHVVPRWIIESEGYSIRDKDLHKRLKKDIAQTWFCPVTDSMRINAFYHVNHIDNFEFRPDWKSLAIFGSEDKIRKYIRDKKIRRLVLIEDFVGTGTQMEKAAQFAARLIDERFQVLVVPLVLCPKGQERAGKISATYPNVTFLPALNLPAGQFITEAATLNEPQLHTALRDLIFRIPATHETCSEGPLGFRKTGGLVVMYSNCPNNTIPAVWNETPSWAPLFPRSKRI